MFCRSWPSRVRCNALRFAVGLATLFFFAHTTIGYNFKSLQEISPYFEPSGSGISSLWARTQALKHDCTVIVGYPEKVDLSDRWPANPEYYNSAIVVSYDGDTVANYRKTHLYYTDETWALENPKGFFGKPLPGLGRVSIGICMDLKYEMRSGAVLTFANLC